MPDKILIVDDDFELRSELKDFLQGFEVVEAPDGEGALRLLKRANEIGLVILDVMMPGVNGIDVLNEIKRTDPSLRVVILTGHSSKDVAIEALKGHADDYLEKPVDPRRLEEIVEKLLENTGNKTDVNAAGIKGKIEKVKLFVERNCYKKISLNEAAQSVCLSPKYLSRIFKKNTGKGFSEYRLRIKIEKSKELLAKTAYNVNQITEKLGYENAESFIRQFKKFTGFTPTEYRKKADKKRRKAKLARRKK